MSKDYQPVLVRSLRVGDTILCPAREGAEERVVSAHQYFGKSYVRTDKHDHILKPNRNGLPQVIGATTRYSAPRTDCTGAAGTRCQGRGFRAILGRFLG